MSSNTTHTVIFLNLKYVKFDNCFVSTMLQESENLDEAQVLQFVKLR